MDGFVHRLQHRWRYCFGTEGRFAVQFAGDAAGHPDQGRGRGGVFHLRGALPLVR